MAKYQKTSFTQGAWVKASQIKSGTIAKIVSETNPQPSQFLNKDGSAKNQDVAKVLFGRNTEPLNVSLNRTTINGLISAFGEESNDWKNKPLRAETEKARVAGKAVVALYLIPEGYKKIDDDNGFAVIVPKDEASKTSEEEIPVIEEDEMNTGEMSTEDHSF